MQPNLSQNSVKYEKFTAPHVVTNFFNIPLKENIICFYIFFIILQGDSGGPLQCRTSKRGPWMLVGITSFGSGCAYEGYPDVYTKISNYNNWIFETIEKNSI
jgi:hypothetical protein